MNTLQHLTACVCGQLANYLVVQYISHTIKTIEAVIHTSTTIALGMISIGNLVE